MSATETVDEAHDEGQALQTGPVEDAELELSRKVAKRLGWKSPEDWDRLPENFVDAPEYLENTPREIETLKERLKRTGQAAADALEEERRRARIAAQAEIRQAAKDGDEEAAARAAEKLERSAGPPAETVAWINRNGWFNEDPDAQVLAVAEINRMAAQGASIPDQLQAAEAKVKKRFPEHFETLQERPSETKLSETRRPVPPAVAAGSRGGVSQPKVKGYNDIPAQDRRQFETKLSRRFQSNFKMTEEAAQTMYAKSYWKDHE